MNDIEVLSKRLGFLQITNKQIDKEMSIEITLANNI